MATEDFFDESREASKVKAQIVVKYLVVWARVMASQTDGKLIYFDPFAGPGAYADGSKSTPLLVVDAAIASEQLQRQLVIALGDKDKEFCTQLSANVDAIPGLAKLTKRPTVVCDDVDKSLASVLSQVELIPTFAFLDPWGYKGLTLDLVNSLVKDWGCDCLFFFNYNRINAGLTNLKVDEHVVALFGGERTGRLREEILGLAPDSREQVIMGALVAALQEGVGNFVHMFRFMAPDGTRTSHYLVFVSKHFKGYEIMRDIMDKASSYAESDVPSYVYTPKPPHPGLFDVFLMEDLKRDLRALLVRDGPLKVRDIFERHSAGRRYVLRNYKTALKQMEDSGQIVVEAGTRKRRTGSMPDWVSIRAVGS